MDWYKSFDKQVEACRKDDKIFTLKPGQIDALKVEITICIPFKTICGPSICKSTRFGLSSTTDKEDGK